MPRDISRQAQHLVELSTKHPHSRSFYNVSFSEPNRHMIYVSQLVKPGPSQQNIVFKLPAWRPGRYTIQNYAAQVSQVSAINEKGELPCHKTDKQTWEVETEASEWVCLSYQFFAPSPVDAGNCYLGADEIFLNHSNMLMSVEDFRFEPAILQLEPPKDWQVATDLASLEGVLHHYVAGSYDELIDSPVMLAPQIKHIQFQTHDTGFHCYVQSEHLFEETGLDEEAISGDIINIIREQMSMMKDNPLKRDYAFMYHFLLFRFYHGVEHAYTSSIVLGPASELKQKYDEFLSITSHEFFHLWCVKRIVPDVFAPYDYSREAYTTLLYIFEGFTSYYGDLVLLRSGLWSIETYLDHLGKAINYVQHNYGRKVQTLGDSSYNAWLTGYRRGADLNSINFYVKGELVGLCLDFELRQRTAHAVTLDHVMRELNVRFAQNNKGFSEAEFEALVDELSGSSFKSFFDYYIRSTGEIPYNEILSHAGLNLQVAPDSACPSSIGAVMDNTNTEWPTIKFAIPDSAAFQAGLDQNDMLVAIDQWQLQNKTLPDILSKYKAGQSVEVSYIRGSELYRTSLTLEENLTYKVIPIPEQTAGQQEFWSKWTRSSHL